LRRAIERYIEDPLAEELLRTSFSVKDTITVALDETGQNIVFKHSPLVPEEIQAGATPAS
jgi:ATP-dependent Clp protease ATP-binding subunit ClpA